MIILLVILLFSLQFRSVQTYLTQQVAAYLSAELQTTIRVGGIYFKPFSTLSLNDVYIADERGDTLLYVHQLDAEVRLRYITRGAVDIDQIKLVDGAIYLKKQTDTTTNFSFIIHYFNRPTEDNKNKNKFKVSLNRVIIENMHFRYKNMLVDRQISGVNFHDIDVADFNAVFSDIDLKQHLFATTIKQLSFREKSGFHLKRLQGEVIVDSTVMEFKKLYAETNNSHLSNYLRFSFNKFNDFADFVNKVRVQAQMRNTRVDSHDIAFFAPGVNRTEFNIGVKGNVSGTVSKFIGKRMLIKMGKATYLSGQVAVTGLPNIEQTVFNLNLSQFATNKADAEPLIAGFSGNQTFKLPDFLTALNQLNYSGKINGLYHDFKLEGLLKTSLGQIEARGEMDIKTGGKYQLSFVSENLKLGPIVHDNHLGAISFSSTIQGKGFMMDDLAANIAANVAFIEYKGHRYEHLNLAAQVMDKVLKGDVQVDSREVKLATEVIADFSRAKPLYNASVQIDRADLYQLDIVKDSLTIEGIMKAELIGDGLNDLVGQIDIRKGVLRMPNYSAAIDSVVVRANGNADDRMFTVQSDILDAQMKGRIDLNAFPVYFKSIVKQYLPSWKIDLPSSDQSFDFSLRLKRTQPLLMLFAPAIHIPDTMIVNGKFLSGDSIANLNAYIPQLDVGNFKMKDIIIDGVAGDEALSLIITADRFNITDSLYIENINLSNVLSNDSLRFNVKLSDIDAQNQMDLNGLVAFREDEAAQLSLLPSNIIINQDNWKLEDQVNFDFHKGDIRINGFELANGEQHVKVSGSISNNETGVLDVMFSKFNLATLAGITNPLGIHLTGELDGTFQLFSLLKNPYVSADISSSDIYYNEHEIGDMTLEAAMDPGTKLVNMEMEVMRQDLRTLKITGSYNAKAEENSLNLNAAFEKSEIVLFEPFLKKLVSDLEGTVSADIAIKGTPWSPVISGQCAFNDASFTVNYLKTRYTINDEVEVQNSTIALHQLEISDKNKNKAVANGTVDMSNPLDPVIDVQIKAKNFMALNTTAKDNPLYYGVAVGTGDFSFKGPTSSMDIDIKAATEDGTVFNIPLNASGTISENDFITFVSKDSTFSETKSSYFGGLTLHIDLDISRNAEANIFTDLGKLSGVGNGNITMNITSLGDFEMFGDYVILQGKFTFTAQDFINKIFEISRGGTIRWTGNPEEALINLTAVYEVRTSVRPLYIAAGRPATDQRVVAQAEMTLGGNLLHPEIAFALDFPTDSYVKDELQNYFSDANNVNQQALSLIVRRSFAPGTGTDLTTELNSTFLSAGTELAFNQLNNVIAQSLNLNFVDFNIRSFNEASASIRLLNNRLLLTGGVTDRRSELNDFNLFSNQVASDVEALYLIRKNGNLLFRASNRLNNRNFLNPNDEYVSAFGLVYRQEFDTLGEFFRKMFSISRKKTVKEHDKKTPQAESK